MKKSIADHKVIQNIYGRVVSIVIDIASGSLVPPNTFVRLFYEYIFSSGSF
jgi:hypothetical protein